MGKRKTLEWICFRVIVLLVGSNAASEVEVGRIGDRGELRSEGRSRWRSEIDPESDRIEALRLAGN
jgi:hypothetical protein